jgi:hypothetical protein
MSFKRLAALSSCFLALCLLLAFCACNGGGEPAETVAESVTEGSTVTESEAPETETEAQESAAESDTMTSQFAESTETVSLAETAEATTEGEEIELPKVEFD